MNEKRREDSVVDIHTLSSILISRKMVEEKNTSY